MKRRSHPNSKHPIIRAMNRVVYSVFKPKWDGNGWLYGRLYYYGDTQMGQPELDPRWFLDGMTPVDPWCVLDLLEARGRDVSRYQEFFRGLARAKQRKARRDLKLRLSAKKKITRAERRACGL